MQYCKVIGRATDASGGALAHVVFVPIALSSAGVVDARREIAVRTDESGAFEARLVPGRYQVHIGRSRFDVTVPAQAIAQLASLLPTGGEV